MTVWNPGKHLSRLSCHFICRCLMICIHLDRDRTLGEQRGDLLNNMFVSSEQLIASKFFCFAGEFFCYQRRVCCLAVEKTKKIQNLTGFIRVTAIEKNLSFYIVWTHMFVRNKR